MALCDTAWAACITCKVWQARLWDARAQWALHTQARSGLTEASVVAAILQWAAPAMARRLVAWVATQAVLHIRPAVEPAAAQGDRAGNSAPTSTLRPFSIFPLAPGSIKVLT
jgi:hypothetical protein